MELLIILIGGLFWGWMSALVGRPKDIKGFWYGFFLGIIGFIIVCCMKDRSERVNTATVMVNNNQENSENKYETLEKLYKLKDEGVLTEYEFNKEKNKIMNS